MNKLTQFEIDTKNNYKICKICLTEKPLTSFYISNKNGYKLYYLTCIECKSKDHKLKYNYKNKKKKLEIDLNNGYKTCTKCNITKNLSEFYFLNYPDNRHVGYNSQCKECIKIHKRTISKTEIFKKRRNIQRSQRLKNDPNYKFRVYLSNRINLALKGISSKSAKTLELLGCSVDFCKKYLESKFLSGMTWQNHGFGNDKWHIDHIIPCEAFDLTKPEEQRKCFHYSNLQPLWQHDNLSKCDKVNGIRASLLKSS